MLSVAIKTTGNGLHIFPHPSDVDIAVPSAGFEARADERALHLQYPAVGVEQDGFVMCPSHAGESQLTEITQLI